jgi:AAA domain
VTLKENRPAGKRGGITQHDQTVNQDSSDNDDQPDKSVQRLREYVANERAAQARSATDWEPAPTGRLAPWFVLPGIDDLDWRDAEYAIADGVKLYLASSNARQIFEHVTAAIAEHNIAAINAWHEDRRRARKRWQATHNLSGDELRNRAVGLLDWKHNKLAALEPNTTRDDDTSRAIWYLAGLVNDGHLDRAEVTDTLLDASHANRHIPGNKSEAQVRDDINRGLTKAPHGFDWDRMTDRPGWDAPSDYTAIARSAGQKGKPESKGDPSEPDDDDGHRSWMPVDLTDVLDGTWQPPKPTVGRRIDGIGLFYPGKMHTVSSESEAGKTWFALAACRDEILRGNHVEYIDFEDDEGSVTARLITLGLDAKQIKQFFHYIRPESPIFLAPNENDVDAMLAAYRPTLVVVDGITEAMTLHELNPLDNADAAKFGRLVPRRLAQDGAAVASLDHVTKSPEGRGRYAIGAVHKLNALNGAAYILENRNPFGIDRRGVSTIRIAKDRPGQLRKHAVPSSSGMFWFADLIVDTTLDGLGEGAAAVVEPNAPDQKPTIIMGRICAALAGKPEGLPQRVLCDVVTGKTETIRKGLSYLIADGYITATSPHTLIHDYLDDIGCVDEKE